jgi:hypothetical protein
MNRIFLAAAGRLPPPAPADELQDATAEFDAAEATGDQSRVDAAAERLRLAVDASREHELEEKRQIREAFSSGARRPIPPPRPSPSQQMNLALLRLTGRAQ